MIIDEPEEIIKREDENIQNNSINNSESNIPGEECWVTDEGEDVYNYYRLKVDNINKIKLDLNKSLRKTKNIKYKKIDEGRSVMLTKNTAYFNQNVYPNIGLKDNKLYHEDEFLKTINFIDSEYNVTNKSEIGSALVLEINKKRLNLVGVTQSFYEPTRKNHYLRKRQDRPKKLKLTNNKNINNSENINNNVNNINSVNKNSSRRRKRVKKNIQNNLEIKKNILERSTNNNLKKKKKRKRNKERKHIKNSTIIEIKKIS
jgi:hypothetical protein